MVLTEADARYLLNQRILEMAPGGQQKIADALHIHNSTVSACASGKFPVTPRIAAYLGLTIERQRIYRVKA